MSGLSSGPAVAPSADGSDTPGPAAAPTASRTASVQVRVLVSAPLNLGPGKMRLLQAVADTGSLSAAARVLKISYRRAWLMLDGLNKAFPTPLVETAAGGPKGGGSRLTPLGRRVLERYRALCAAAEAAVTTEAAALLALTGQDGR